MSIKIKRLTGSIQSGLSSLVLASGTITGMTKITTKGGNYIFKSDGAVSTVDNIVKNSEISTGVSVTSVHSTDYCMLMMIDKGSQSGFTSIFNGTRLYLMVFGSQTEIDSMNPENLLYIDDTSGAYTGLPFDNTYGHNLDLNGSYKLATSTIISKLPNYQKNILSNVPSIYVWKIASEFDADTSGTSIDWFYWNECVSGVDGIMYITDDELSAVNGTEYSLHNTNQSIAYLPKQTIIDNTNPDHYLDKDALQYTVWREANMRSNIFFYNTTGSTFGDILRNDNVRWSKIYPRAAFNVKYQTQTLCYDEAYTVLKTDFMNNLVATDEAQLLALRNYFLEMQLTDKAYLRSFANISKLNYFLVFNSNTLSRETTITGPTMIAMHPYKWAALNVGYTSAGYYGPTSPVKPSGYNFTTSSVQTVPNVDTTVLKRFQSWTSPIGTNATAPIAAKTITTADPFGYEIQTVTEFNTALGNSNLVTLTRTENMEPNWYMVMRSTTITNKISLSQAQVISLLGSINYYNSSYSGQVNLDQIRSMNASILDTCSKKTGLAIISRSTKDAPGTYTIS